MNIKEESIFYCKDCNKLYNSCYELEGITMCSRCWSEDIQEIPESKILAFIRNKRLKRLNEISETNNDITRTN